MRQANIVPPDLSSPVLGPTAREETAIFIGSSLHGLLRSPALSLSSIVHRAFSPIVALKTRCPLWSARSEPEEACQNRARLTISPGSKAQAAGSNRGSQPPLPNIHWRGLGRAEERTTCDKATSAGRNQFRLE
jgi:hypothetical protein